MTLDDEPARLDSTIRLAPEALAKVQQRAQALPSLREASLSCLDQQEAEKEKKALQDRLAMERLRQQGEELAAQWGPREGLRVRCSKAGAGKGCSFVAKAKAKKARQVEKEAAVAAARLDQTKMADMSC